jgi:CheY-like chemotaxis protein
MVLASQRGASGTVRLDSTCVTTGRSSTDPGQSFLATSDGGPCAKVSSGPSTSVTILGTDHGIQIVRVVADGEAGVISFQWLRPDVVLMDSRMPVLDGLEATRRILVDGAPWGGARSHAGWFKEHAVLRALRARPRTAWLSVPRGQPCAIATRHTRVN